MWWWISVVYYLGALLTFRQGVLLLANRREQRDGRIAKFWYKENTAGWLVPAVPLWPIVAFGYLSWRLIFPHGVRTRAARQREREAHLRIIEQAAAKCREKEQEAYQQAAQMLREYIVEQDAIEAAMPLALRAGPTDEVLDYSVAETCFAEACEQVWRERGKPWGIGALTAVRIRNKVGSRS